LVTDRRAYWLITIGCVDVEVVDVVGVELVVAVVVAVGAVVDVVVVLEALVSFWPSVARFTLTQPQASKKS
jgi:hypothetical protein